MATECSAKAGVVEADEATLRWIAARRPGTERRERCGRKMVAPDPGADYAGGVHAIDLSAIRPDGGHAGRPRQGHPLRPHQRRLIDDLREVPIDIAYGGSCTAGKEADLDLYAQVMREALAAGQAREATGVDFFIQFGSEAVEEYARRRGLRRRLREDGRARSSTPAAAPASAAAPACRDDRGAGHRLRHQPQLPEPLGPGTALPRLAPDRRRLGGGGPDRRLPRRDVRRVEAGRALRPPQNGRAACIPGGRGDDPRRTQGSTRRR